MSRLEQIQMVYYATCSVVAVVLALVVIRKAGYFQYRQRRSRMDMIERENERLLEQYTYLREDIALLDQSVSKLRKQKNGFKNNNHFNPHKRYRKE